MKSNEKRCANNWLADQKHDFLRRQKCVQLDTIAGHINGKKLRIQAEQHEYIRSADFAEKNK